LRASALRTVEDAALAAIAARDPDDQVRHAAIEHLTDQTVLVRLALQDRYRQNRYAAVAKVTNRSVLREISNSDSGAWGIGAAARARLKQLDGIN
jgi:hypothetical protein